jgi:type IV pilus assembly protein PilX
MGQSRNRQQGVVLLIALTVLVAMSLAGVALMRSVDNTVVVAGNMAFKQSSLQVADLGTQQATKWLNANNTSTTLQNTDDAKGYFAARPASEPDWFGPDVWLLSSVLNSGLPDAQGNIIRYVVHRMCDAEGGVDQNCIVSYPLVNAGEGTSKSIGSAGFQGTPQVYYRVTTRVEGPRNNVTVIQSSVLL